MANPRDPTLWSMSGEPFQIMAEEFREPGRQTPARGGKWLLDPSKESLRMRLIQSNIWLTYPHPQFLFFVVSITRRYWFGEKVFSHTMNSMV